MNPRPPLIAACAVALAGSAGCVGMADAPSLPGHGEPAPRPPERPLEQRCDAGAVQHYLGKRASAETGQAILAQSGAAMLRWGPPESVWTMDYREDRINVRYDREMTIIAISCG